MHLIHVLESKIRQPNFKTIELKKAIVLIRHSRNGFKLKLNNCVYLMSFISFRSNINYIFKPPNSYTVECLRLRL